MFDFFIITMEWLSKATILLLSKLLTKLSMHHYILSCVTDYLGTAVAQWLRCCATNRKVAGSIPAGVIGIFH